MIELLKAEEKKRQGGIGVAKSAKPVPTVHKETKVKRRDIIIDILDIIDSLDSFNTFVESRIVF